MAEDALIEIVVDRLYFVSLHRVPQSDDAHHYFTVDEDLCYKPYFADFGPMSLAEVHRYIALVRCKLRSAQLTNARVVHVSSHDLRDRSNVAFLVCAFRLVHEGVSAEEAFRPFANRYPPLWSFRDASYGPSKFDLEVIDCLEGLSKALHFQWYAPQMFDEEKFANRAEPCNGGLSWIIPGKLLAFMGPSANRRGQDGAQRCSPSDYLQVFRELGVLLVIRLNSKEYDSKEFTAHGIRHLDMHFPDGSCPSPEIIERFLSAVQSQPGAVAVHCRAGLGRTGVLAGLYAMRHYEISARATIGWCRLARPGTLLGSQQQFLCDMEGAMATLRKASEDSFNNAKAVTSGKSMQHVLRRVPSPVRSRSLMVQQDVGQGEWLASSSLSGPQERPAQQPGTWQRLLGLWDRASSWS